MKILDGRRVDFEYDGEMAADVALNRDLMAAQYPFCRLTGPGERAGHAGVPLGLDLDQDAAGLGGATVVGPLIVGLDKPVQIVSMGCHRRDIVNMAALAGYNIGG